MKAGSDKTTVSLTFSGIRGEKVKKHLEGYPALERACSVNLNAVEVRNDPTAGTELMGTGKTGPPTAAVVMVTSDWFEETPSKGNRMLNVFGIRTCTLVCGGIL